MAKRPRGRVPLYLIVFSSFQVLLAPSTVSCAEAGAAVTEAEVVRLFRARGPDIRAVSLAAEVAATEWRADARLVNPKLSYQIEDSAGVRDEFLMVEQEVPITGRRVLFRQAGEAGMTAATLAAENAFFRSTQALRSAFYEVIHRESTAALLREGTLRLDRIVEILTTREREGEAAGFDVLRAEMERAELEIAVAQAQAEVVAARSRFGAFFDPGERMDTAELAGEIEPDDAMPDAASAIEAALVRRGDLAALRALGTRLEIEERSALRALWPEPVLSAGWKRTEVESLADTGFVAGVSFALPVLDRGGHAAARASAERQRIGLEAEILARAIRAEVRTAIARERAVRETARRHGTFALERANQLRQIAELAYEDGESGILELLDAYRAALATELRVLALRHESRQAQIERVRAVGTEVKP